MPLKHHLRVIALASALALFLAACSAPEGGDSVLIVGTDKVGNYNPVNGYAVDGISPFYDGLLRPKADPGQGAMPELAPALAADPPTATDDQRTWTVKLRDDVTFSDGSALDSGDVAATYRAVIDPASASKVADAFRMIKRIDTLDPHTVVFHLKAPTPNFATRLTLGILPAKAIEKNKPASDWQVNRHPIGTGAYELASLTSNTAVVQARNDYWRTTPALKSVTYQTYDDTSAMANAVANDQIDGAAVPPRAAAHVAGNDHRVITARTADWRGISLPSNNPFTADVDVRRALNIGIDRQKIIDDVLDGHGTVASTPVGAFYGDAYNPAAHFDYDPDAASAALDKAGWKTNAHGIREKNGKAARLTILYPADDSLRADLAAALARQLKALGVAVRTQGSNWDDILGRMKHDAVVYAGGQQPYDVNQQLRGPLHTRTRTSGFLDNPADLEVPGLDQVIDAAAREPDADKAAADYRRAQALYVKAPTWLIIGFLEHTYVADTSGWRTAGTTFEPHSHGTANWGPWWDLADWQKE